MIFKNYSPKYHIISFLLLITGRFAEEYGHAQHGAARHDAIPE